MEYKTNKEGIIKCVLSKLSVKTHVQNLNNGSQISSDFEFASDENSEISFFSASSSVGEDVDAAL